MKIITISCKDKKLMKELTKSIDIFFKKGKLLTAKQVNKILNN